MNYDGKPRHPLPSKKYDIFIQAFEKKVAEAQKEIEFYNSLQRLYQVVWETVNTFDLPNDGGIHMTNGGISIVFTVLETDTYDTFNDIVKALSRSLNGNSYYHGEEKELPRKVEGFSACFEVNWKIQNILTNYGSPARVAFRVNGGENLAGIICRRTKREVPAYTATDYEYEWT